MAIAVTKPMMPVINETISSINATHARVESIEQSSILLLVSYATFAETE